MAGGRTGDGDRATKAGAVAATAKPRKLGRGLSSLLGEVVVVDPHNKGIEEPVVRSSIRPDGRTDVSLPSAPVERAPSGPGSAPVAPAAEPAETIQRVALAAIRPSPFQPRRTFDQGALERLAASIRVAGVMQPVLVRRASGGSGGVKAGPGSGVMYELIAGERRLRAAQLAGLTLLPAVVAEISDEQAAEWALIENLQREELGVMERAWGLRSLTERFGLTHGQVAERVGMDRSSVTNLMRLTELEDAVQAMIEDRRLSMGHARALLGLPAGPARTAVADRAAARGWSVRQMERAVARLARGAAVEIDAAGESPRALARLDLERQLGEHLGTRVRIKARAGGSKGRLVIEFYSLDHFDGLMAKIGFEIK